MKKLLFPLILSVAAAGLNGCSSQSSESIYDSTISVGEGEDDTIANETAREILAEMSTADKIAQMMMPLVSSYEQENISTLPQEIADLLREYSFGGVIINDKSCQDSSQTAQLAISMQEASKGRADLFVAIDQEGGYVTRLANGTQMPGAMALGAANDTAAAEEAGSLIGEELNALAINVDFAPCLDLNSNPLNPVIGIRSYSDDPEKAAALGASFARGLNDSHVIACFKHFPGHGDTAVDSHTGLPLQSGTYEDLKKYALIPFRKNLAEADMVMTAHICFPDIETERAVSASTGEEIYLPATLSKTIITGILRHDLGFDGIVITDALEMDAIDAHFGPLDAAKRAIDAGCDMLLQPIECQSAQGLQDLRDMIAALTEAVEQGEIAMERIDQSVLRILTVKQKYGLLDVRERYINPETVGSKAHHDKEWDIALQGVTLVKNEGVLPLENPGRILYLCPYTSQLAAVEYALDHLEGNGFDIRKITFAEAESTDQLREAAAGADTVIAVSSLYGAGELDPRTEEGYNGACIDAAIEAAHEKGARVIVISSQLPYDLARFQAADALLAVYSARGIAVYPDFSKETPQFGPNISAGLYQLLAGRIPEGALPVAIPAIGEDYTYTDTILYPSGFSLK
ncbi:MAG: hypothetical protein IKD69_11595 [Solobacterium sp.]|nr:hypothetical protein [Solobacterium sp.]